MGALKVFTFSPAWGLPTTGPFALKLLKWLDLAGLPYQQVFRDLPSKGPKGKNPWIELDGRTIGDTEIIIETLERRSGFNIDAGLSPDQLAISHAIRRMIEEHFHMIYEWELFVHPDGAAGARQMVATVVPPIVAGPIAKYIGRRFKKQLHARGLARHEMPIVIRKARADIDAVEAILGAKSFLLGARPCMADVAIYGLMYPLSRWPMHTPAADDIKSRPRLLAYLERLHLLKAGTRMAA